LEKVHYAKPIDKDVSMFPRQESTIFYVKLINYNRMLLYGPDIIGILLPKSSMQSVYVSKYEKNQETQRPEPQEFCLWDRPYRSRFIIWCQWAACF